MSTQQARGFTYLAAAIIVAAVVIGAAIFASSYLGKTATLTQMTTVTTISAITTTTTATTTKTTIVETSSSGQTSTFATASSNTHTTSTTSTASTGSGSTDTALLGPCPTINYSFMYAKVTVGSSSPTLICIRFYYYNSTAPLTLNLTKMLTIQGNKFAISNGENQSYSFNGESNFTVATSQSQLVIGGPTDENEGVNVTYAFTAKAGASGTYELAFLPAGPKTWMVGAQEPLYCEYYVQLVEGDGHPSYSFPTNCITYSTTSSASAEIVSSSSSEYITIPGIPYPLTVGYTYFQIVGATNSTG